MLKLRKRVLFLVSLPVRPSVCPSAPEHPVVPALFLKPHTYIIRRAEQSLGSVQGAPAAPAEDPGWLPELAHSHL